MAYTEYLGWMWNLDEKNALRSASQDWENPWHSGGQMKSAEGVSVIPGQVEEPSYWG